MSSSNMTTSISSKHAEHETWIVSQVAAARSYAEITAGLAERGCVTTRSEVHGWLQRRLEKIRRRATLVDPIAIGLDLAMSGLKDLAAAHAAAIPAAAPVQQLALAGHHRG